MAGFYERLRDTTAAPLIARFGRDVTIKRVVEAYDVDTGANNKTVTPQVVKAVVFNYETIEGGDQYQSGLQRGTRRVVCSAKGIAFVPQAGDMVEIDGEDWQIARVIPTSPGGIAVLYELEASR